jgi:DNA-binding GntR family transcriptional regulator
MGNPILTGSQRHDGAAPSDQDIYDRIFEAVLDRRLQPGAHLREASLAEMFGVSRTKVRQALVKLIQAGIAEQRPNRGTAVAAPTKRQTRELLDLRAILEPALASDLAQQRSAADVERLRRHIAHEDSARAGAQNADLIRLTGEFHLLLAELLGNALIHDLLTGLEAKTCLSILSYARADSCACLPHEHRDILEAIAARDGDRAREHMALHLAHVRAELDLEERAPEVFDLSAALGVPARRGPR